MTIRYRGLEPLPVQVDSHKTTVPKEEGGYAGTAHKQGLRIREWQAVQRTLDHVTLARRRICRGKPDYIRSDNGPEFVALALRKWIADVGTQTAYIEPGSPWENGYCESFISKLRDELLSVEVFYSLREAEVLIESWRRHFNTVRPHSSLRYIPPAPEAVLPRSGTVALWPGAPALEGAPPANPDVAIKPVLH